MNRVDFLAKPGMELVITASGTSVHAYYDYDKRTLCGGLNRWS